MEFVSGPGPRRCACECPRSADVWSQLIVVQVESLSGVTELSVVVALETIAAATAEGCQTRTLRLERTLLVGPGLAR